jgi:hypothetical protein
VSLKFKTKDQKLKQIPKENVKLLRKENGKKILEERKWKEDIRGKKM